MSTQNKKPQRQDQNNQQGNVPESVVNNVGENVQTTPETETQNTPAETAAPATEGDVKVDEPTVTETPVDVSEVKKENFANIREMAQAYEATASTQTLAIEELEKTMPTMTSRHFFTTLRDFMNGMRPNRPVTQAQCAQYQVKMYRMLDILFNRMTDDEFAAVYPQFLRIYFENCDETTETGVFGMRYVLRGIEDAQLSNVELAALPRLINMINVTCNTSTRAAAVKNTNWEYTMQYGLTENAKARLLAYYGI